MAIMAGSDAPPRSAALSWGIAALVVAGALYFFPLFHVRPLNGPLATTTSASGLDPAASAGKFWAQKLQPATAKASEAATVLSALQRDPAAAAKRHAHQVGIGGTAYYFVRGT